MEKEPTEEEDFWNFEAKRGKSPHFDVKSKKDEYNISNKKEGINNNKQPLDHVEGGEKKNGDTIERSVRIEYLIKDLEKLKPKQDDRSKVGESEKLNACVNEDHRRVEHRISSVGDDHSENGNTSSEFEGLSSDGETHGTISKERKEKDFKLGDVQSKSNNTNRYADQLSLSKKDEEDSLTRRSHMTDDESKLLKEYDTFIDYGLKDEQLQSRRDTPVEASDSFVLNEDSEELTFIVHPPTLGDPGRSRRKTRRPVTGVKSSKRSKDSLKGQALNNQRPVYADEGESFDEDQSPKISQEAESSGNETKATQKHKSRRRQAKPTSGNSPENLGSDRTGGETEGSRSPPRMRKDLRSGDYDWSVSGNEEIREWVKRKNRIARKQKAEERRKERIKKREADGEIIGDEEKKSVEASERKKKKPKPKQRSNICPEDGRASDREVFSRSKSQPRMSKELRSGDFDWSKSNNEKIRVWLKTKKRLIRKQQVEEKKKEKLTKKEEENKRREHEEMYADSHERVNEWLQLKKKQDYLSRKRQKEEQIKAEQNKEKVMVIGRKLNYEPILTERQDDASENQEEPTLRTDQKQETILKAEPLLKQREKQRQLLLSSGLKQPNQSHSSKQNERKETVKTETQQEANITEEIAVHIASTIPNLPSADKRSNPVKTPYRRGPSEPVVLPRQSLSPAKGNIPTANVKISTETDHLKKKIAFDDWLKRKKADNEKRRLAAKEQEKNLEELSKSVEIKKMNLSPEKKRIPTGSVENLNRRVTRVTQSASRQRKQPQVKLAEESVAGQQQESESKAREADGTTIEDISDVAEASENSTRPSRSSSKKRKGSNKTAAREMVTDKVPIIGGSSTPDIRHGKSPKPKLATRPILRSVKYQQGSWERFSNYLWDQVIEAEDAELTTSCDQQRVEPMGAEADKIQSSFELKIEKREYFSRPGKKVEVSTEESVSSESRLDTRVGMCSSVNIESEIPVSDVPDNESSADELLGGPIAGGGYSGEFKELLNKGEKSKILFQSKNVDDNFNESDMRNSGEVVASGLINEKEGRQLATLDEKENNSMLTDGGFGTSNVAQKNNIRTIIDAEDEEMDLEEEATSDMKLDTQVEAKIEIPTESNLDKLEKSSETEKAGKSSGNHVHLSDSETEIMSDIEFLGSDSSTGNNAD